CGVIAALPDPATMRDAVAAVLDPAAEHGANGNGSRSSTEGAGGAFPAEVVYDAVLGCVLQAGGVLDEAQHCHSRHPYARVVDLLLHGGANPTAAARAASSPVVAGAVSGGGGGAGDVPRTPRILALAASPVSKATQPVLDKAMASLLLRLSARLHMLDEASRPDMAAVLGRSRERELRVAVRAEELQLVEGLQGFALEIATDIGGRRACNLTRAWRSYGRLGGRGRSLRQQQHKHPLRQRIPRSWLLDCPSHVAPAVDCNYMRVHANAVLRHSACIGATPAPPLAPPPHPATRPPRPTSTLTAADDLMSGRGLRAYDAQTMVEVLHLRIGLLKALANYRPVSSVGQVSSGTTALTQWVAGARAFASGLPRLELTCRLVHIVGKAAEMAEVVGYEGVLPYLALKAAALCREELRAEGQGAEGQATGGRCTDISRRVSSWLTRLMGLDPEAPGPLAGLLHGGGAAMRRCFASGNLGEYGFPKFAALVECLQAVSCLAGLNCAPA
ncbi:hypothetical protein TSOC_013396, partial [Tetrabaena socialis]